jgi:cell wall-associated NlpC family hydrolase
VKGLNASVPVGIETASGVEWKKVNQQQDGGDWVQVGVFKMPAGDDYSVQFSPEMDGEGYAAADAVKVVKVSSDAPPPEPREKKDDSATPKGREVVKEARTYMRAPYHLGRASRTRGMDCSGFTMLVYRKFGVSLPHDVRAQAHYGSKDQKPRPGDLVFFNEHGRGISHVGIATGRGTIIHASNYFHRVTETPIKSVKGYVGSKRLL